MSTAYERPRPTRYLGQDRSMAAAGGRGRDAEAFQRRFVGYGPTFRRRFERLAFPQAGSVRGQRPRANGLSRRLTGPTRSGPSR
jgi:hypothetical protein